MTQGLSQEKLAERCGCHPTYIGQLERGEKNPTIESVGKVAAALGIPLSQLFEKLDTAQPAESSIPLQCYELLSTKAPKEQAQLFRILLEAERYRDL